MTAGMSDSPTTKSGRRPSSNSVTAMPFSVSSEPSVAPDGPLPMMPTVLMEVLIMIRNWVYGRPTTRHYLRFSANQVNAKSTGTGIAA